jgi:hypothetical protein
MKNNIILRFIVLFLLSCILYFTLYPKKYSIKYSPDKVKIYIKQLKYNDWKLRENAAVNLGIIGDSSAIKPLIVALKDKNNKVRVNVAWALGQLIATEAVVPLIELLKDNDVEVKCNAIYSLKKIKDYRSFKPLIRLLNDKNAIVRQNVKTALIELKDLNVVEDLINLVKHSDSNLKIITIQILGEIGDARAVNPLIKMLKEDDKIVKKETISALIKIGDPRAIEHLQSLIKEGKTSIEKHIRDAIGRIKYKQANRKILKNILIAHYNGLLKLIYDKNNKQYIEKSLADIKGLRHLSLSKNCLFASTLDTIISFNSQFKKIREKLVGKIGAIASYQDNLLISVDGYFTSYDRILNKLCQIEILRNFEVLKNAHDILIYKNTAYLLDNIIEPVFILKIDVHNVKKLKVNEATRIYAAPPNSTPHLDGQWLNPVKDFWVLILSASSYCNMGGLGGPFQKLIICSIKRENLSEYFDDTSLYNNSILLYLSEDLYEESDDEDNIHHCFKIISTTQFEPVWAVVLEKNDYYLVKMKTELRKDTEDLFLDSKYNLFISNYFYLDSVTEINTKKVKIDKYRDIVYITIGNRLMVIDVGNKPKLLLDQKLLYDINDFVLLNYWKKG